MFRLERKRHFAFDESKITRNKGKFAPKGKGAEGGGEEEAPDVNENREFDEGTNAGGAVSDHGLDRRETLDELGSGNQSLKEIAGALAEDHGDHPLLEGMDDENKKRIIGRLTYGLVQYNKEGYSGGSRGIASKPKGKTTADLVSNPKFGKQAKKYASGLGLDGKQLHQLAIDIFAPGSGASATSDKTKYDGGEVKRNRAD